MSKNNSKKQNGIIKDFASVGFSNLVVLVSGLITGFLIPKLLGVDEYGYFKLYTLYLAYTALLHFGFVDGVLLSTAGKKYEELQKDKYRRYTRFYIIFQSAICSFVALISFLFLTGTNKYIFGLMGIDALLLNLTTYFQYISQSTLRFKELSIRKILLALLKIILTITLLLLHKFNIIPNIEAWMYILGIVIIDLLLLIFYLVTYREIIFGEKSKDESVLLDIKTFFRNGIILTISFQVSHLIFILDRQFVSALFEIKQYSLYAFAYSLISIIVTVISALSMVLFPRLKRMTKEQIVKSYSTVLRLVSIFSMGAITMSLPLSTIVSSYLKDYAGSILYLKIIIPCLALNCCINIVLFTYYKSLNMHKSFFKISCLILLLSAATNGISYILFKTPESISIASIVTMVIWYIMCSQQLKKKFNVPWLKNFGYIVSLMIVYYSLSILIKAEAIVVSIYAIIYGAVTYGLYKYEIKNFLKRPKRKSNI